jgi:hypothetical protein
MVFGYFEFLDRLLNRRPLIRLTMDDAEQLSRRPSESIDAPGVTLLLGRSFRHREVHFNRAPARGWIEAMEVAGALCPILDGVDRDK